MNRKLSILVLLVFCSVSLAVYAQEMYTGQPWTPPKTFKGEAKVWAPPKAVQLPVTAWAPPPAFKGEVKPWLPPKTFPKTEMKPWQPPKEIVPGQTPIQILVPSKPTQTPVSKPVEQLPETPIKKQVLPPPQAPHTKWNKLPTNSLNIGSMGLGSSSETGQPN